MSNELEDIFKVPDPGPELTFAILKLQNISDSEMDDYIASLNLPEDLAILQYLFKNRKTNPDLRTKIGRRLYY